MDPKVGGRSPLEGARIDACRAKNVKQVVLLNHFSLMIPPWHRFVVLFPVIHVYVLSLQV